MKASDSSVQSMTGFARAEGSSEFSTAIYQWVWEVRSLNNKGLDTKLRMPNWLDAIETDVRRAIKHKFTRGSITANIQIASDAVGAEYSIDHEALDQIIKISREVDQKYQIGNPSMDGLLAVRGILTTNEIELCDTDLSQLMRSVLKSFQACCDDLHVARSQEGAEIHKTLVVQLSEIRTLVEKSRDAAEAVPAAIHQRLQKQLTELIGEGLSEERLAQEVAILAVKADVREELDRFEAHLTAADELTKEKSAIGRRFDFLLQEFNREANTLCSKAQTMELKRIGLDLKATIDQLREQIQNIE